VDSNVGRYGRRHGFVALAFVPGRMRIHNKNLWSHPHFASYTLAQFLRGGTGGHLLVLYKLHSRRNSASGRGFSTIRCPGRQRRRQMREGTYFVNEQGATKLLSIGFTLFMIGRFAGSAILRKASAHVTLGVYCLINTLLMSWSL